MDEGLREKIGVDKQLVAVVNTRGGIGKHSMILNNAMPQMEVDPKPMKCVRTANFSPVSR